MNKQSGRSLMDAFDRWRSEDRDLAESVGELREWMDEAGEHVEPRFGEAANRLQPLRDRLVLHFKREDEIVSLIAATLSEPSAEFDQLLAGAAHDHEMLLAWMDDLSMRFSEGDPPFRSWAACAQRGGDGRRPFGRTRGDGAQLVQLFVDRLELQDLTDV